MGTAFVHTVIDDPSRVAYAEIHDDEAAATAVLRNATPWLTDRGVTIQRVLSANGSAYRSHAWREACSELGSIPSGPGPTGLAACMTWFLCPYRPRQVEPVRQSLPGAGDQDAQHPTSDPCSRPLRRPGAIVRTSTEVTDRPGWALQATNHRLFSSPTPLRPRVARRTSRPAATRTAATVRGPRASTGRGHVPSAAGGGPLTWGFVSGVTVRDRNFQPSVVRSYSSS
jgi:hypothetical protein